MFLDGQFGRHSRTCKDGFRRYLQILTANFTRASSTLPVRDFFLNFTDKHDITAFHMTIQQYWTQSAGVSVEIQNSRHSDIIWYFFRHFVSIADGRISGPTIGRSKLDRERIKLCLMEIVSLTKWICILSWWCVN